MKAKLEIVFSILVSIFFLLNLEIYSQKKVFIEAHIVYSSSLGINGINPNDVITSINQIITTYSSNNTGITFELGFTDYLDNPNFVNVVRGNGEEHSQQAEDLFNLFTKPGAIHVIFVPILDQQGVAYDIPSRKIIMANGSALNNETLAHEMGHCLGLHHTYRGNENVTRNTNSPYYNATTQGDFLHDTPADPVNDPNKFGPFIYNCQFTNPSNTHSPPPENALYVDPNYILVKNIMSLPKFSLNCSRYHFTAGQIGRMNDDYLNENGPLSDLLNNIKTTVTNKFNEGTITNSTLTIDSRTYNSGDNSYLKQTSTHTGKTNHERFYSYQTFNIKHHDWNDDILQYHQIENFNVSAASNFRDANFNIMNTITSINSKAESSVFFNSDMEFKDPWYLFSGNVQLSDQNNAWVPNSNPNWLKGAFDQTSGGVFLDQEYIPSQPNKPYYSIRIPQYQDKFLMQTGKTHRFYLNDWTSSGPVNVVSPNLNESPVVFLGSGSTITANLKGTQLSNDQNAYTNNSQRKFIRTHYNEMLHVYSSMNKTWLESSTDNGTTWISRNNGKPLTQQNSKLPSICQIGQSYVIICVQEEKPNGTYYIKVLLYDLSWDMIRAEAVATESYNKLYTEDANPVVACPRDGISKFLIVWEEADYGEWEPGGLFYRYVNLSDTPEISWLSYPNVISGTDLNSHMPTLVTDFSDDQYPLYFRLAYEQHYSETSSDIFHSVITADANNQISIAEASNVSTGAGFTKNTKPSMIAASDYYGTGSRLCWIGYRQGEIFIDPEDPIGMGKVAEGGESYEQKVVFMDPGYRDHYWNFGSEVQSTQINKSNACYSIGWGISDSYPIQFADCYTLSNIYTINDLFGKEMQMCNGTTRTTMRIMAFNTSTSPYNFNSKHLYATDKVSMVNVGKGREGVVYKDSARFFFALGDLMVNGQSVPFIEVEDTVSIYSKQRLNELVISESFNLNDNTNFIYSVQYGITDSSATVYVLDNDDFVNFKVELRDDQTGELLGLFDNITYTESNVAQYNNIAYQVNTQGIGNRTVRLKLVTDNNFDPKYSLADRYAEGNALLKTDFKQVSFQGSLAVDNYDLSQNYPNPFNPTTTINYQIKEDGLVTLKIYDILGSEVSTLVNEEKTQGRYAYNFNASDLASGVYIYQLRVNPSTSSGQSFVSSKKLILLK